MFAHIGNRFSIFYVVSNVVKLITKPSTMHYGVVHCIFKYLQDSVHLGLRLSKGPYPNLLQTYFGADFVIDLSNRKSCSGFLVSMNGSSILWGSRKQIGVTSSTIEVEYVVVNITTREVVWTRYLLMDLWFQQLGPTKLFNDNQSNIWLIHNLEFHHCTKHIDIQYHLICDHQTWEMVNIFYINNHD